MLYSQTMDENIVKDIDRYYAYATILAGEYGHDLLHSVLIDFNNKRGLVGDDLFRYVSRILKNELYRKDSNFNKQYNPRNTEDFDSDRTSGYDTVQLDDILSELIDEGHEDKVNLFLDVLNNKITVQQVANEMEVSRMFIYRNYITFVRNEIKKRYVFD